jgi:deferrochelatase/peroxidase EfeB
MSETILPLPAPRLAGNFQPGVTDPVWPATAPSGVDSDAYKKVYAGRLERQRYLLIVTANVTPDVVAGSHRALAEVLEALNKFARHQMIRTPEHPEHRPFDPPIRNPRVTVTVGYGATLFTTPEGDDRFGLASVKPTWLKIIPPIQGDDPGFSPRAYATDFIILLASDDPYVNEYLFGLIHYGNVHPGIAVQTLERGYARPDSREPGGFEDGSSNPLDAERDSPMHNFVYVREGDDEPDWCIHGTYLGYRKIQRRLKAFFKLHPHQQDEIMGANRITGDRIPGMPAHCHKFKMNPRRHEPDLFGIKDDGRQILRRPYFYDDGVNSQGDARGHELRGVHHLSFARNLALQYEWRIQMWQMNQNFPQQHSGADSLYSPNGGAMNVGGGYYFVPGVSNANLRSPIDEPAHFTQRY